jgi:hypothetical protein
MSAHSGCGDGEPETVKTLQGKLRDLGYYKGPCDGLRNKALDRALLQFWRKRAIDTKPGEYRKALDAIMAQERVPFSDVLAAELNALRPGATTPVSTPRGERLQGETPRPGTPTNEPPPQGTPPAPTTPCAAPPTSSEQVIKDAHQAALAGLAFSGGGIRSATFNLGMLQALAEARMLHHFDYLSTVSGGGYIGGWLSKWIFKCGGVSAVQDRLARTAATAKTRREPTEITFLRQYSNYLTPRVGLFTADTWTFFATYIRNTLLNFLILGLFLAWLLILPRLWVIVVSKASAQWSHAFLALAAVAFLGMVHNIAFAISCKQDPSAKAPHDQLWVLEHIVGPLVLAAMLGSAGLWWVRETIVSGWVRSHLPQVLAAPGFIYFLAWATGWDRAQYYGGVTGPAPGLIERMKAKLAVFRDKGLPHLFCAVGAFAIGTALVIGLAAAVGEAGVQNLVHVASFGTPVLLAIFGITIVIMIGLVGRRYSDQSREWWSRQGGWTFIAVIGTTALFLFSLYGPALAMWAYAHFGGWFSALLASGWLGTAWATVSASRNPAVGKPGKKPLLKWLVRFGPPLVMALTFVVIATSIYLALTRQLPAKDEEFNAILRYQMAAAGETDWTLLLTAALVCIAAALIFAYRVDVNKFSLYMMYRNRLVRAYLGAIDAGYRHANPFTGFAPEDDIPLAQLSGSNGTAQRPYLIMNAALNLVKGDELAWQTRKAANFTFTPRYCGFETPAMPVSCSAGSDAEAERGGYRRTELYGAVSSDPDPADKGLKLGMAMAVSGAAVASSMGASSSAAMAFMMTLFNVRLGRWCGNPASRDESWINASPPAGLAHLFKEMFGFTDATAPYLYLSDGGHFENLGIYELVRRRCRLIVAVDATADRELHFADLGNAIRKCYTDFNIEIDINVKNLELASDTQWSSAYYVVGKILYSVADPYATDGILLYIKPSLLGTELAEITNYYLSNPEFPHQSTADQWFDETQFESYRSLGLHIGRAVFPDLAPAVKAAPGSAAAVEQLCTALDRSVRQQRRRDFSWWHARRWL